MSILTAEIVVEKFLAEMRDHQKISQQQAEIRRRLFTRATADPKAVLTYLDGLPPGEEAKDDLLRTLRLIAAHMLFTAAEACEQPGQAP
jgi:hypothetical protein